MHKTTSIWADSTIELDSKEYVDELKVELYKNDKLLWTGDCSDNGKYILPVTANSDSRYKVVFTDEQELNLTASDSIPAPIKILKATYQDSVYTDIEGTVLGRISLSFCDDIMSKNYYEIVVLDRDKKALGYFVVKSPVVTVDSNIDVNAPSSIMFTDELFDGEKLNLDIYVANLNPTVVLKNVSRNYYKYRQSINSHFFNQNTSREDVYDLFKADPVELYSNINNGIGIFAGFTQDVKVCDKIN